MTLADEDGFTLVELILSLAIGGMVLAATVTMFTAGMSSARASDDRTEATQRARLSFDKITRLVGAQVCNGVGNAGSPVVAGDKDHVFFTANVGKADDDPIGYELRYVPATNTLWEYQYPLTGAENPAGYKAWANAPTSGVQLLERVVAESGTNVFRYFGTDDAATGAPTELKPDGAALSDTERTRVLRIDLSLRVLPSRTETLDDKPATLMATQNYVTSNIVNGSLDQGPRC